jgi:hypothetical protein
MKDVYDGVGVGVQGELLYEDSIVTLSVSKVMFSAMIWTGHDIYYSNNCHNCSNLFACVGLRSKQYCILNKQYTKEEYEELVPKIIQHMNDMPYVDKMGRVYEYGEFFPPELSPFSYNETIAQEYFPLTKEEAINQGYSWKEEETRNYQITLKTEDIPDNIKDVNDEILEQVIQCGHNSTPRPPGTPEFNTPPSGHPSTRGELNLELNSPSVKGWQASKPDGVVNSCNEQCTTAFKIIPRELDFYRRMNLPLPRLCPNCRHYQRLKQRNPLKLWERQCQCNGNKSSNGIYQNTIIHSHGENPCPVEFQTSYAPERLEIVYCEKCYQQEVY